MEKVVLLGGGGHCISVIDAVIRQNKYKIWGITDLPSIIGKEVEGYKIMASDDELEDVFNSGVRNAFITLGSVGDSSLRRKLYFIAKKIGFNIINIIDPSAIIANSAIISEGTFVGKGSIVNAGSVIDRMVIVNSGAIIEHNCQIGAFVHLAPGCVLSGNVNIGADTHIGTGASIIQGITIGEQTVIGAGSVVVSSIGSRVTAYGNPCKINRERR